MGMRVFCFFILVGIIVSSSQILDGYAEPLPELKLEIPPIDHKFDSPEDVAIDSAGNIYVIDKINHVQKFDSDGNFIIEFLIFGSSIDPSNGPFDVTISISDQIVVSSFYLGLETYDTSGNLLSTNYDFEVVSVTVDLVGNVYKSYGITNNFVYGNGVVFGDGGPGIDGGDLGWFNDPKGLEVDSSGYVYVADTGNNRIQKFYPNGHFSMLVDGTGFGIFGGPASIVVDSSNRIYVADGGNNIQKYDKQGDFLGEFYVKDIIPAHNVASVLPYNDIVIDSSDTLYIGDSLGNVIKKLDFTGNLIDEFDPKTLNFYGSSFRLSIDPAENIYVTEVESGGILRKFDVNGIYLTSLPFQSSGHMAFNSNNHIYLIDPSQKTVQHFNRNGSFRTDLAVANSGQYFGGIATDISDNIYVSDTLNGMILEFDSNEALLPNTFNMPYGNKIYTGDMTFDDLGTLHILDTNNDRILQLDSNGDFLKEIWTRQIRTFNGTHNILDDSSNFYIADTANHRIQKFDKDGNFLFQFGVFCDMSNTSSCIDWDDLGPLQPGDGQFNNPVGIAMDGTGDIYVSDRDNHRIQKFDKDGNFLMKITMGQFSTPIGITTDSQDNVYIDDLGAIKIKKFDPDGNFLTEFGDFGTGIGQLEYPTDVFVDSVGDIYVFDLGIVKKFDSNGDFISEFQPDIVQSSHYDSMTVDSLSNTYIADTGNNQIQKFDQNGKLLYNLPLPAQPTNIEVNDSDELYVFSNNDRVLIFTTPVIGFNSVDYEINRAAEITVTDNTANLNLNVVDSVTISIKSSVDPGFTTDIFETDVDTGVFVKNIFLSDGRTNPQFDVLHANAGTFVSTSYNTFSTVASITPKNTDIDFSRGNTIEFDADIYTIGAGASIEARPTNCIKNNGIQDMIDLHVFAVSGDVTGFIIPLTETDVNSCRFINSNLLTFSDFSSISDPSISGFPQIQVDVNNFVFANILGEPFVQKVFVTEEANDRLTGGLAVAADRANCIADTDKDGLRRLGDKFRP